MRADEIEKSLLLSLFRSGSGSLGRLGFGHPLLEFIHASGCIHKFLLAGVKRMAHIANANDNHRLGGAGLDHVATGATNFRIHILRMYINFHKRPEKIPLRRWMTSRKFGILGIPSLCQQLLDYFSLDVRKAKIPALEAVSEFCVFESKQIEERGVQIMHMHLVLDDVETKFIGFA